ncbi:MAG: nuclear transport factor 2 family protein [Bacteroidota bacterium]
MKKLLFCLFWCLSLSLTAQNKDQKEIQMILDSQTKYWNEGNLEQFMQGYWHDDSLVFIGKSGLTYGFEKTLANYKRNYPDLATMGNLEFDIKKVEKLSKKIYFVIGKWHLARKEKGDLQGHYSLIFKKIGKKWTIISDHSS